MIPSVNLSSHRFYVFLQCVSQNNSFHCKKFLNYSFCTCNEVKNTFAIISKTKKHFKVVLRLKVGKNWKFCVNSFKLCRTLKLASDSSPSYTTCRLMIRLLVHAAHKLKLWQNEKLFQFGDRIIWRHYSTALLQNAVKLSQKKL